MEELLKKANEYAKDILGDAQFKKNKDAVNSITTDFMNGYKLAQKELYSEEEVLKLINELCYHLGEYEGDGELWFEQFKKK